MKEILNYEYKKTTNEENHNPQQQSISKSKQKPTTKYKSITDKIQINS